MITSDNAPIIEGLLQMVNREKPDVGQTVKIVAGKRTGTVGIVKKHMKSRYVDAYRYGSPMQHHMTDARGRYGYAVLVGCENGVTFWIDARNVMNCCTKEWA